MPNSPGHFDMVVCKKLFPALYEACIGWQLTRDYQDYRIDRNAKGNHKTIVPNQVIIRIKYNLDRTHGINLLMVVYKIFPSDSGNIQ